MGCIYRVLYTTTTTTQCMGHSHSPLIYLACTCNAVKSVMKIENHWLVVFSAVFLNLYTGAAVDQIPLQVVPQGIQAVNGSDTNMGCSREPITFGGVTYCGVFTENDGISYLVDGNSPAIDTDTSNWASELVTVRKSGATRSLSFDHVLLTFDFDTAVSLTRIELDLFICPEWNIGAPQITVYVDNTSSLNLSDMSTTVLRYEPPNIQASCDSLSIFHIPLQAAVGNSAYYTWHVVVTFSSQPDIEWVHVGEMRFYEAVTDSDATLNPQTREQVTRFTETSTLARLSTKVPTLSTPTCTETSSRNNHPLSTDAGCPEPIPTVTVSTSSPQSPSRITIIILLVGLIAGVLAITIVIIIMVVVLLRRQQRKSPPIDEPAYDYVEPPQPPILELMNNNAYGKLQTNTLPTHGLFSQPKIQPNVCYGVIEQSSDLSNDGYELTDAVRSYAAPLSPSLAIV